MPHSFFSTETLLLPATSIKYIQRLYLSSIANIYECFMARVMRCSCGALDLHKPLLMNTSPAVLVKQSSGAAGQNHQHQSKRFGTSCQAYSLNSPGCHTELFNKESCFLLLSHILLLKNNKKTPKQLKAFIGDFQVETCTHAVSNFIEHYVSQCCSSLLQWLWVVWEANM